MLCVNKYFAMGLRERVALTIAVILFIQVILVWGSPKTKVQENESNKQQNQKKSLSTKQPSILKTKSKQISDKSQETILKTFNFPDIEYPTVSNSRPHFYLQESNVLQNNQMHQTTEKPSAAQSSMSDNTKNVKYKNKKYNNLIKVKPKSTGITKTLPEIGVTAKPYKEVEFPEVEYPLSTWDTLQANRWKQIPSYVPTDITNDQTNTFSQGGTNLKSRKSSSNKNSITSAAVPKTTSIKKPSYKSTQNKTSLTPSEETKTQESFFTPMPDNTLNGNLNKLDKCFNISNLSSKDPITTPFKIHNEEKMPTVSGDNKVTLISDAMNNAVPKNIDNRDSSSVDNVRNNNKSSEGDVDEEFTTDVFPDFDENVFTISTSTMSPLSVVDVDNDWSNSVVIDPYKSVSCPDELDEYFIVLP